MNAYRIARVKARRNVLHSKKTSWRNYVSKMNSQTSLKSVWNRIRKIKGLKSSNIIRHLSDTNRDVMSHRDIANALTVQMELLLYIKKLKSRIVTFHLKVLKYTTGSSLCKSCRMLYVEPMILQQDQMKYTINF